MTTIHHSSVETPEADEPPQLITPEVKCKISSHHAATTHGLEIRKTKFGKGVFAKKEYRCGEIILRFKGRLYSKQAYLSKVKPEKCYYMQIDDEIFLGPTSSADNFVNHCCEPNAGLKKDKLKCFLVATQTIHIGQEITFDYSTSMAEDHWEMDCACGAPSCRGRIRDFKYLPRALQYKYIELGIAPDFVMRSAGLFDPHDLFHANPVNPTNEMELVPFHIAPA
ncbi:MAG TPA: SET domain-containing protein-lysine N-methyltransferase [Turneriella sp.]|nr:SET domain-containing protein-lysine N-methyltransferase [Turneriella sp.]